MEPALAAVVVVYFLGSIFLLTSTNLIRILLGVALLGNAANLTIFTAGRLTREVPPVIPEGAMQPLAQTANPLPQALILTAIVIAFALFAFILVLVYRSYQELGSENVDRMREAEPLEYPRPPEGY
ncbi:multisubunit sodium/proton antiporter MrpC subunit [Dichotomicrobium thermohalophilum]|uniref:Multisubunit sodium/proton antiporter MrpC subunit n=2 Tax=Dichotomicrobium thermohalophilum TaxID=933063 RepID=A0A397Q6S8_9HYPH|nr:multisubunit sodium/proton antiporter MrpC subunit [Dichotomicrobium thermohalophilum]